MMNETLDPAAGDSVLLFRQTYEFTIARFGYRATCKRPASPYLAPLVG